MQLKDLLERIITSNRIMLSTKDGDFFPTFEELYKHRLSIVGKIESYDKGTILVEII